MYCFSSICRICLESVETDLIKLSNFDTDNVKINDKLIFCIPEIFYPPNNNLPETICVDCHQFIQRMYEFKQICINHTITLNNYAFKLSNLSGVSEKNNLFIKLEKSSRIDELLTNNNIETHNNERSVTPIIESVLQSPTVLNENQIKKEIEEYQEEIDNKSEKSLRIDEFINNNLETHNERSVTPIIESVSQSPTILNEDLFKIKENQELETKSVILDDTADTQPSNFSEPFSESPKGLSMYSVSLNKWDSFETKYTCRCIKEFTSFTENTKHLCKNCEGELLGFRLSKTKVVEADAGYNIINETKIKDEDLDSSNSENGDSDDYEHGFDYNDLLLCKVHINGVKKQISYLENNINLNHEDETIESETKNTINSTVNQHRIGNTCPICKKTFSRTYYLNNHFELHPGCKLNECNQCRRKFINKKDLEKHKLNHRLVKNKQKHSFNFISTRNDNSFQEFGHHFLTPTFDTPTTSTSLPNTYASFDNQSDSEDEGEVEDEHNLSKSSKNSEINSSDEILTCSTCDKIFTSKAKLAIHLMTHFGQKDYKCSVCQKEFFRKENLELHLEAHQIMPLTQQDIRKYKCPYCDKNYNNVSNVRRHIKDIHNVKKIACHICNLVFIEKHMLEQHIFDVHSFDENTPEEEDKRNKEDAQQTKYKCPYCDKYYYNISYVRRHMRENHDIIKFYCFICDHIFSKKEMLDQHIINEHTVNETDGDNDQIVKRYKCPHCKKNYNNISNLRRHMRENHDLKKFNCFICDLKFPDKEILEQHVFDEHTVKEEVIDPAEEDEKHQQSVLPYLCPTCDRYYTKKNMQRHMRESHGLNKFFCNSCDEMFDDKQTLEEHVFKVHKRHSTHKNNDQEENEDHQESEDSQVQQNMKKYKCPNCDKSYNHLTNVRRHLRDFHSVDKFLCSICNETFVEKRTLEKHIFNAHSQGETKNSSDENEEDKFTCPICYKHFNHLSNLRMHALSHADASESTNELNYCNVCKKHYSKNTSMTRHMSTHISGNVFECAACPAKFDNRWVFRQHMKSKHPNYIPEFQCKDCLKMYTTNFSLQKHRRLHTK